jgi:hypothetical protein
MGWAARKGNTITEYQKALRGAWAPLKCYFDFLLLFLSVFVVVFSFRLLANRRWQVPTWTEGKRIFLDADHAIVISEPTGAPLPQGSFILLLLWSPGMERHTLSKKIGLLLLWAVVLVFSESKYSF